MFIANHADQRNTYINYVFPTLSDKTDGYCDILNDIFKVVDVSLYKELKSIKPYKSKHIKSELPY